MLDYKLPLNYKIEEVSWHTRKDDLLKVRFKVFVEEQNVPLNIEIDEWDRESSHLLVEYQGKSIGTGRLLPDGHIGRIAVLENHRNKGIGNAITDRLIQMAKTAGHSRVELSAQLTARDFYVKIGFKPVGTVYEEAGIPHIAMVLML